MRTLITVILLSVANTSWAQSCTTNFQMASNGLIDDFTTGQGPLYSLKTAGSWLPPKTQIGNPWNVVGGERGFQAQVTINYLRQPVNVDVTSNTDPRAQDPAALVLTTGVREGFGLYDFYGYDAEHNVSKPLGLSFPGGNCDRVRIWFDSNLADLHVLFQIRVPGDTAWYQSGTTIGPQPPNASRFCMDIPFASYVALGMTSPFTTKGIDYMLLNIGSGNAAAGDSFAISKIEFANASTGITCKYSVP